MSSDAIEAEKKDLAAALSPGVLEVISLIYVFAEVCAGTAQARRRQAQTSCCSRRLCSRCSCTAFSLGRSCCSWEINFWRIFHVRCGSSPACPACTRVRCSSPRS
jgi:hypothetical protein